MLQLRVAISTRETPLSVVSGRQPAEAIECGLGLVVP